MRYLFLAHVNKMNNPDLPEKERLTIMIEGNYDIVLYDALNGSKRKIVSAFDGYRTTFIQDVYDHDSLLLVLQPREGTGEKSTIPKRPISGERIVLPTQMKYSLHEPNVLVLDQAEYAFDGGEWMAREELLRIDNCFREKLGYQLRMQAYPQPWVQEDQTGTPHILSLKFNIASDIDVQGVRLALENKNACIRWNGKQVPVCETGWYTDRDIITISLGDVRKGMNELLVDIPYGPKTNIENLFLLGSFGVRLCGREARITKLPETVCFGDLVGQGFPFYGGNFEYHIPVDIPKDGEMQVVCARFRSPLLKVGMDEEQAQMIAFSPYTTKFSCKKGEHVLHLTAFGNRVNTFGTLHNCNETEPWYGPNAWRTKEHAWSYEYCLKRTGVLKTPEVFLNK